MAVHTYTNSNFLIDDESVGGQSDFIGVYHHIVREEEGCGTFFAENFI